MKNQEKTKSRKTFRSAHDTPKIVNTFNSGKSKTQQQFKEESDIYNVLAKHTRGLPIRINANQAQYLDVSEINPDTHHVKVENLKKDLAQKEEKAQKLQNEEMEKQENAKFEEYEKRKLAKNGNNENPKPDDKKNVQK